MFCQDMHRVHISGAFLKCMRGVYLSCGCGFCMQDPRASRQYFATCYALRLELQLLQFCRVFCCAPASTVVTAGCCTSCFQGLSVAKI
jgi:hypothetical protein